MIQSSIRILNDLFNRIPSLKVCEDDIKNTIDILYGCFDHNNKLIVCGNGGSASDAQHIVGELRKPFNIKRPILSKLLSEIKDRYNSSYNYLTENLFYGFPVISLLGENALSSAINNDMKPDLIYAQQLIGIGNKNDILLVLSTSGNSKNIIYVCQIARCLGMKIIGLSGESGGELVKYSDVLIKAPAKKTFLIQEYHLPIYHAICAIIENEFFGE